MDFGVTGRWAGKRTGYDSVGQFRGDRTAGGSGGTDFAALAAARLQEKNVPGVGMLNRTKGASGVDAYTQYLKQKYGSVRIERIGKDQRSLDKIGKSMSGNDVVIAPNILEQMAHDPEKAAYYEGKIDYFFDTVIPTETALCAAQGLVYEPCGVVVHEDGTVTYIGGCADSPARVAEVNAINRAKREKRAAQRKAVMEQSREAAEIWRQQTEMTYKKKKIMEVL